MNEIVHWIDSLFRSIGMPEGFIREADRVIAVLLSFLLAFAITGAAKRWVVPMLHRIVMHTSSTWDEILLNTKVLRAACNLFPALILLYIVPSLTPDGVTPRSIEVLCQIYLTIAVLLLGNSLIDAIYDLWNSFENLRDKPIKGYLQVFKLLFYIITVIVIIAILLERSPVVLLTGLGASAAILSLVFKDSIMGLIAGIQLSANDMVRKGDWITVSKHNINGVVEEITLNTVKVKNFDATMLTIPPQLLVLESFQNWRTMKEGGARRVKKSIMIDVQTVRFYCLEEAATLSGYSFVEDDPALDKEGEAVVNLTLLRLYLQRYLRAHPLITTDMYCTVRELQHTPQGIPIELLFFIAETEWGKYETIQAAILDHVTAIVPHFGLRIFQQPSGQDILQLGRLQPDTPHEK